MAKIRYRAEILVDILVDDSEYSKIFIVNMKAQEISNKIPEDSFVGKVKRLPHGSDNILRKEDEI